MLKSLATGDESGQKSKSSEAKDIGKVTAQRKPSRRLASHVKDQTKVMERGAKSQTALQISKIVDDMVVFQTFNPIVWFFCSTYPQGIILFVQRQ